MALCNTIYDMFNCMYNCIGNQLLDITLFTNIIFVVFAYIYGLFISLYIFISNYDSIQSDSNLLFIFISCLINGGLTLFFMLSYIIINLKHLFYNELLIPLTNILVKYFTLIIPIISIFWIISVKIILDSYNALTNIYYGYHIYLLYIYIIPIIYVSIIIMVLLNRFCKKKNRT